MPVIAESEKADIAESNHYVTHEAFRTLNPLTGCNLETIRYYEKIGLMTDTPREENGARTMKTLCGVYGSSFEPVSSDLQSNRSAGFSI